MTKKGMFDELKKDFTSVRLLVLLLTIAVSIYLFGIAWQVITQFSDILIILILSWILSFVLEPVVARISSKTRLSLVWSTFITYILLTGLFVIVIFLFVPELITQIQTLAKVLPSYLTSYPIFQNRFDSAITSVLNNSLSLASSLAQFFVSLIFVLILSFYFIVDKEKINDEIFELTPKKWHERLTFFQEVIEDTFTSFLRVQLLFGLTAGLATWVVLKTLGVDFAASSSVLAGIFTMVPLIGPFLGLIPPLLVAFIADPTKAVVALIILFVVQQIIFNVMGPKLLGKAFRIHPAVVLVSFLIGLRIAGGIGAILAIPVLGIATVIMRKLGRHFLKS
ncbi:MAG: hypothetical protein A3A47_02010 [Candidatus Levybacteria bacterium RIFCSPLOWO2_01_FULL_37_20]|nr:MAG: hypothetical protein A3A47_02010 [Candidatus Levybacteria bacterium RIFCSPLOWO2_01_FULL_37_20]OGH44775.1 MAG: hypothetical protein A3J14_02270 [Candidatus Levybacteria bacterium RIFCSPLOWO2_02_FULL_37_18]